VGDDVKILSLFFFEKRKKKRLRVRERRKLKTIVTIVTSSPSYPGGVF
jgi:hypothetical protein